MTIKFYEEKIKMMEAKIAKNKDDEGFYEPTPIVTPHDTGISSYQACLQNIEYYKKKIDKLREMC